MSGRIPLEIGIGRQNVLAVVIAPSVSGMERFLSLSRAHTTTKERASEPAKQTKGSNANVVV